MQYTSDSDQFWWIYGVLTLNKNVIYYDNEPTQKFWKLSGVRNLKKIVNRFYKEQESQTHNYTRAALWSP